MKLVTAPTAPPADHVVADRFVRQTPRPRALAIIQKAFLRRDVVQLGAMHLRFCKRGDQFQEGEDWLEARENGLYQRFAVYLSGTPLDHAPDTYTWIYVGDIGWFEEVINPILEHLSAYECECALVQLTFTQVMRELQEKRTNGQRETDDGTAPSSTP